MYRVIIADDEEKIRGGIAHLFPWNQMGYQVVGTFANGRDALEYVKENPVDVVFSDIRMPIMDGLEMAEKIMTVSKAKIILFSGYQDFEYARQAMRSGVSDYLLKPVKYEELQDSLTRIRELLDEEQDMEPERNLSYYEKIISAVRHYLDEEYQTATLEQAARLVNLSPNYLSRLFKEHSSLSFSDYLLKTRMENAARMLRDIRYKQYEIAFRVGYDNPKNFSRAFHQYFQMSPSQYRSAPDGKEE